MFDLTQQRINQLVFLHFVKYFSLAENQALSLAPGNAVITVTTKDGGKTAACTVTVKAPTVPIGEGAVSVSGEVMAYSVWLPGSGEPARLIAGWYDENGRMLGCAVEDVTQDGLKTGTINVKKDQKEYRLFALDGESGKPLTKALTTGG